MAALTTRTDHTAPHRGRPGVRPSTVRLVADQLGYAVRDLWRSRIAFIFTFLFPLTFLLVLGAIAGTDTISSDSTVRVMQLVTPSAAVMGALYGSFPTVAYSLADARERGILKRMHGTPLPGWVYLAGRIGAAVVFALGSLTLMLMVGVIAYDVEIRWHTMPATAVTVLAAVTCFAALGVAVAGLAHSANVAMAASIATAVALSMVSGVMSYGDMPAWADRFAQVFPLRPFNEALGQQFDPSVPGNGWDLSALAVIGTWTAGAVVVAMLTFRWEPVPARAPRAHTGGRVPDADVEASDRHHGTRGPVEAVVTGRPTLLELGTDQAWWATRAALHDIAWVFFAVGVPVGQYVFTAAVMGDAYAGTDISPPYELQSATAMIAWAVIVTVMVFMPEAMARDRDLGILKRLRGTPLQTPVYFTGRFASALLLVLTTAVLILLSGLLWVDLQISWSGVPLALGLLVLGTATLAACGLLLATVLPSSKAVTAVGLGLAIPLGFFSDVFAIEVVPAWMSTVGSFFPLKHLANGLSYALDPAGTTVSWTAITVMTAWLLATGLLAARLFRWSARD